ncbi:hypothetical protein J5J09_06030 [Ciceribacter sp. L1K22]|nr:hypothetical protein [Ciceribacter sp. L1K22]
MIDDRDRITAVRALARLERPLDDVLIAVSKFEWDYHGSPFILRKKYVEDILQRYLSRKLTDVELETWADAVELREDIAFDENHSQWLEDVITTLSSHELNGPTNRDRILSFLK